MILTTKEIGKSSVKPAVAWYILETEDTETSQCNQLTAKGLRQKCLRKGWLTLPVCLPSVILFLQEPLEHLITEFNKKQKNIIQFVTTSKVPQKCVYFRVYMYFWRGYGAVILWQSIYLFILLVQFLKVHLIGFLVLF